jgi:phosphoribosylglycinamide formyltransferase-1
VLISGGGSNLQAIIDACESGSLDAKIVFVGSDNPQAMGLERAKQQGIPVFCVDYSTIIRQTKKDPASVHLPDDFDLSRVVTTMKHVSKEQTSSRLEAFLKARIPAEAELLGQLKNYDFDLLVLAGFMRTLTPYFIDRINTQPGIYRIMNIHPALLPSFPGVDGYGDTYRYGCKVGGCTVHYIDYGEDTGPIIAQSSFDISEEDDLKTIREKGLLHEWRLYPKCIQYAADGRLKTEERTHQLKNGQTIKRTIVKILAKL